MQCQWEIDDAMFCPNKAIGQMKFVGDAPLVAACELHMMLGLTEHLKWDDRVQEVIHYPGNA